METLRIALPLIVILILMFLVVPLIIKLKPNFIRFAKLNDDGSLILNDKQLRCFKSILLRKEGLNKTKIVLTANDEIKKASINLAYFHNKKTIIKTYQINFKKSSSQEIWLKDDIKLVQIFINQINDETYKEQVIQHVLPRNILIFSLLETLLVGLFEAEVLALFIFISPFLDRGTFEIPCLSVIGVLILLVSFVGIYYFTNKHYQKYNNGGYTNE